MTTKDPQQLLLQGELVELRQLMELANRRVAELEEERRRLNGELDEHRAEQARLGQQLAEYHDLLNRNPATGLPIRRVLDTDIADVLRQVAGQVRGPVVAVGLLRLDRDYAKIKNTRDRNRVLLFKTADRIREIIGDNVYQSDRLDEFLLILRSMPNIDGVELRADQIVEAVSRHHEPPADDVRFGCHLGIAVYPDHGRSREDILGNADIALLESERSRAPYVVYGDDMGVRYREREYLETELKLAIHSGFQGFSLSYQPFVDREGTIRGSEALLRWSHPGLGQVSPDRFIPLAEEIGAVRFLGQWTLYRAARQLKLWHAAGFTELYVSVNLSPAQFKQADLVERIDGIIESLDLDPRFLKLELTETTVMEDPEEAIGKMNDLRSMGVRLALDDFGTGYSSLSYLRRFPFETLKIDRSFVSGIDTNHNDQEIVRAMIAMSRAFGMQTLAEGVETREELDFLFGEGCDLIQGYHYSRAVPPEQFSALLDHGFSSAMNDDDGYPA